MAEILAKLTLDTFRENNIPILKVPRGDYNARFVTVIVSSQGIAEKVGSTAVVQIKGERMADGAVQSFDGTVNADGSVKVPITKWMAALEGDVYCTVSVSGADYKYSTNKFIVEVMPNPDEGGTDGDDMTEDQYTVILEKINSLTSRVEALEQNGGGGSGTAGKGVDSIELRPPAVYVPFTDGAGKVLNPAYPLYDYDDHIDYKYKPGLLEMFGGESFTGTYEMSNGTRVEINVKRTSTGISIAVDGVSKGNYPDGYDVVYAKESAVSVVWLEIVDAEGQRISSDIYLGYPRMYSKADLPAGYVTRNYLYKINFSDATFQYIVIKDGFSPTVTVERGAPVATLATSTVTAVFDLPAGTTQVHIEGTSTGVGSGGAGVLFKQYYSGGAEISSATMVSGNDATTYPVDVTYDVSAFASRIGIVSGDGTGTFTCDLRITFIGAEATNVTVTDASGTKTASIFDGVDGKSIGYISLMQTSTDSEGRVQRHYDVFYTDDSTVGSFTVTDGKDGAAGANGADGYTPVKGTDYWTSADKTEMVNAVITALPKYAGEVS